MLSVGFIPASSLKIGNETYRFNNSFIQSVGVDFSIIERFNIFTTIDIRETKSESIYFDPYRADFLIGFEANYKGFELGITHECNHDIITGNSFNDYNGWEGAWMNIYFGWTKNYIITDRISITPAFYLGYRPYDNLIIKSITNNVDEYFEDHYSIFGDCDHTMFGKIGASINLYEYVNVNLLFQPEFSLEDGKWSIMKGNINIEGRYRNLALGLDWTMQKKIRSDAYAINEFTIYISFKGQTSLF